MLAQSGKPETAARFPHGVILRSMVREARRCLGSRRRLFQRIFALLSRHSLRGKGPARAFSSVGESAVLIRLRSLVRVQKGPPRGDRDARRGNTRGTLSPCCGDVAQLGERLPCTEEVRGSNPLISTPGND